MTSLRNLLKSSGHRLTIPRQTVFEALERSSQPLAIAEILKLSEQIDRASVYRTLDLFINLGIVEIVPIGWKKRYELAGDYRPHHHHLHCNLCDETISINPPTLEKLIQDLANQYSYQISDHHFELYGTCSNCRKKL